MHDHLEIAWVAYRPRVPGGPKERVESRYSIRADDLDQMTFASQVIVERANEQRRKVEALIKEEQ